MNDGLGPKQTVKQNIKKYYYPKTFWHFLKREASGETRSGVPFRWRRGTWPCDGCCRSPERCSRRGLMSTGRLQKKMKKKLLIKNNIIGKRGLVRVLDENLTNF
jgi:hypothetical protein